MAGDILLSTLRAQLDDEREQLRRQLDDLGANGGDNGLTFDENFADSGQVAAEQGETRMLVASLRDQLGDVEHALAKMEAKMEAGSSTSYGTCERCGVEIGEARLEAMPATRYCIQHA